MKTENLSLVAETEDIYQDHQVSQLADYLEVHLGDLGEPSEQLSEYTGSLPIILSSRQRPQSAERSEEEAKLVSVASSDKIEKVEVELETARHNTNILDELRCGDNELIISYYNQESTPSVDRLIEIVEKCNQYGDIARIEVFAEDRADTLNLLQMINIADQNGLRVAGVSLGIRGKPTRVLAPIYGSELAYALIDSDEERKGGEIDIQRLSSLIEDIEKDDDDIELMDSLKEKFEDFPGSV